MKPQIMSSFSFPSQSVSEDAGRFTIHTVPLTATIWTNPLIVGELFLNVFRPDVVQPNGTLGQVASVSIPAPEVESIMVFVAAWAREAALRERTTADLLARGYRRGVPAIVASSNVVPAEFLLDLATRSPGFLASSLDRIAKALKFCGIEIEKMPDRGQTVN